MSSHTLSSHQHHVGSLLRTSQLMKAQEFRAASNISEEEFLKVQDEAIRYALKVQERTGFTIVNDGEYQRNMFNDNVFDGLSGFEKIEGQLLTNFRAYMPWGQVMAMAGAEPGEAPGMSVRCNGKITHIKSSCLPELQRLQSLLPESQWSSIKLTIVSPAWHHIRYTLGNVYPSHVYSNDGAYFADVASAYRTEIKVLYDAGLRNLQFDSPDYSFFCDAKMRAGLESEGVDPDALCDTYIKLTNDCLAEVPQDMHVYMHICRGNYQSMHFASGSYSTIAAKLFRSLPNVSTFLLEYDTPRAGDFTPLLHVPAFKNIILGIVTTKTGALESFTELKAKVLEAADVMAKGAGESREMALKRIGVSPQCGFASSSKGNDIDEVGMMLKLMLVRDLAQDIFSK